MAFVFVWQILFKLGFAIICALLNHKQMSFWNLWLDSLHITTTCSKLRKKPLHSVSCLLFCCFLKLLCIILICNCLLSLHFLIIKFYKDSWGKGSFWPHLLTTPHIQKSYVCYKIIFFQNIHVQSITIQLISKSVGIGFIIICYFLFSVNSISPMIIISYYKVLQSRIC